MGFTNTEPKSRALWLRRHCQKKKATARLTFSGSDLREDSALLGDGKKSHHFSMQKSFRKATSVGEFNRSCRRTKQLVHHDPARSVCNAGTEENCHRRAGLLLHFSKPDLLKEGSKPSSAFPCYANNPPLPPLKKWQADSATQRNASDSLRPLTWNAFVQILIFLLLFF